MRTRYKALIIAGLAILLGCVETTSVQSPADINPNESFTVILNTLATDSSWNGPKTGLLAILIPEIWSVDSVHGEGYGYFGSLEFYGFVSGPEAYLPHASSGYHWAIWDTPIALSVDSGDTGYVNANITSTDSLGVFQLAFCCGFVGPYTPGWEDSPCSCLVAVTPLNLEQTTWGTIKSSMGE